MPTWSRSERVPRAWTNWLKAALVAVLATGVLGMHALAGGAATAADHTGTAHSTASSEAAPTGALTAQHDSDHGTGSHSVLHCGPAGVCLALVALGLVLLAASRAGRPLVRRRGDSISSTLQVLRSRARLPDPPDLHSLSILRC